MERSRCYIKAEARRKVINTLEGLLDELPRANREERDVWSEVKRLKERLDKDVRSLVNNRDYAVKGQAQNEDTPLSSGGV